MHVLIIISISILTVFVLLPLIVARLLMRKFLRRYDMDKYSFSLRLEDMQDEYAPRLVTFPSNDNMLCGYIFGEQNQGSLIVFCHGLFGGAAEYFAFAKHFVDKGFAVFMFDNTGCNESQGKSIKSSLQGLYDLEAAFRYIQENEPELLKRKIALVGHSWGGFAAAAYRTRMANVGCVVSLAGYNIAPLAMYDFIKGYYGARLSIILPYCYIMQWLKHGKKGFISAVYNINLTNTPYLIIQGTNDKIIHHDSSSIYNYKSKITNKNVQFILRSDPKHNKHNTIFRDASATAYMESRYKLMKEAKKANPAQAEKVFSQTDRNFINTLDADIMQTIDAFISKELDNM